MEPTNKSTSHKIEISWEEFRKQTFQKALELIQNRNCSTFKIIGYKHLYIRLILYYNDCNEIFEFEKDKEPTHFYTKNKTHDEHMIELKQFKEEFERDIPETNQ